MQYNSNGNVVTTFNKKAVSVISTNDNQASQADHAIQQEKLTFKDNAGLVFVVMVLLLLQMLEKVKILK